METLRDVINKWEEELYEEFNMPVDWRRTEKMFDQAIDELEVYILRYIEKRDRRFLDEPVVIFWEPLKK